MESLDFEGWRVAFDMEATRRACNGMPCGAAEACGCDACRAYAERRAELLVPPLRLLLERLGIDPSKEWEIAWEGRVPAGRRVARVAWRFVGRVLGAAADESALRFEADLGEPGLPLVRLELEVLLERAPEARE